MWFVFSNINLPIFRLLPSRNLMETKPWWNAGKMPRLYGSPGFVKSWALSKGKGVAFLKLMDGSVYLWQCVVQASCDISIIQGLMCIGKIRLHIISGKGPCGMSLAAEKQPDKHRSLKYLALQAARVSLVMQRHPESCANAAWSWTQIFSAEAPKALGLCDPSLPLCPSQPKMGPAPCT